MTASRREHVLKDCVRFDSCTTPLAAAYPQAEKAADWEFTYYRQGVLTHVLNRNVLANPKHAYALYWSTPESEWSRYLRILTTLARTFRPAPP